MSEAYDRALETHRARVMDCLKWLAMNFPELMDGQEEFYMHDLLEHDESRFEDKEYTAFDIYYYGSEVTPEAREAFEKAYLHHIRKNKHHWQYWVIPGKLGGPPVAVEMPRQYVIEMVCDWVSFNSDVVAFWEQNKDTLVLHPNTRAFVQEIIDKIQMRKDGDGYGY